MPRQIGQSIENNFLGGLITESTALNFPENACTELYDCTIDVDGSITRRTGFDFESNYTTKTINRTGFVTNSYVWKNVSGDGDLTLFVLQVGDTIYFYRTDSGAISNGAVSTTVTLTPVSGAPATGTVEAQFTSGNGLLFVTHPYCEPMRISYNTSTDTASATNITLKIRDFEGAAADPYTVEERPTASLSGLNISHKYNLYNQGWNTTNLTSWDSSFTTMPSNADVMWAFKDSTGSFSTNGSVVNNVYRGNTPAPKGHYILTLSNQDRDTASGLSGITATTTGSQRPSLCAFFAGRVFYSGINYTGFNSKIYFTQTVERPEQYGFCYQVNDPTGEDFYDLLPTDGGVIDILEAGTIYKLFPITGGMLVFAANGIWMITGSQGLGFTANDYTIQKISSIETLNASTFVDVAGSPFWWNAEGIHTIQTQGGNPSVTSITDSKIKSFYDDISLGSKRYAKGAYNPILRKIQWLYNSEATDDVTESYQYNRILNFDIVTGAFYPWTVSESDVTINGIFVSDANAGAVIFDTVIDGSSNNVIDANSNQVVVFDFTASNTSPTTKYIVSYPDSGSYKFTFAEDYNEDYVDWYEYDSTGVSYTSYFITGYKIKGRASNKFQNNWTRIYSRQDTPTSYFFQGIWDFAETGSGTGRWSTRQTVQHTSSEDSYSYVSRRLKIRGHGLSLQFKVTSFDGDNFDIVGWSTVESINQLP